MLIEKINRKLKGIDLVMYFIVLPFGVSDNLKLTEMQNAWERKNAKAKMGPKKVKKI